MNILHTSLCTVSQVVSMVPECPSWYRDSVSLNGASSLSRPCTEWEIKRSVMAPFLRSYLCIHYYDGYGTSFVVNVRTFEAHFPCCHCSPASWPRWPRSEPGSAAAARARNTEHQYLAQLTAVKEPLKSAVRAPT